MGGIYAPDIPGVAENNTPILNPYMIQLESYGYMPSKPYAVPLQIGQTTRRSFKWNGYPTRAIALGRTNDLAYIVPKRHINTQIFRAPVPYASNQTFAGQAPVSGVFTGVGEVESCR